MDMMRLVFEISFMVFWICMFIIRYPFAQQNKKNNIVSDKKDGIEKFTLALTSLGMLLLPIVYVATPWFSFADYHLPNAWGIFGLIMLIPVMMLFYRSHRDLGQNWSATLEIRDEHTLVSSGIYKHIRHPMYTAIWLWVICQALLLQNYIAGLSGLISFGVLYFLRVAKEEQMMEIQFGQQYKVYKQKTKRLIPKLF
ncbi:protein-S-isoprenylcysteine O-methyltransferase [Flavobacteriaceae bacterium GF1]